MELLEIEFLQKYYLEHYNKWHIMTQISGLLNKLKREHVGYVDKYYNKIMSRFAVIEQTQYDLLQIILKDNKVKFNKIKKQIIQSRN